MANLFDSMNKTQAQKLTENGQPALSTTLDSTLDLFAVIGTMRARSEDAIIMLFKDAWAEDPTLALKMLFYCRDCRGGQGEKRTFKVIARYLADNYTDRMEKLLQFIPEYGRWDDLYAFDGTQLEDAAYYIMKQQFIIDRNSSHPSVMAKWLKSENTSSAESRRLAAKTRAKFGLTPRQYRKTLADLRKKIDVVEVKMSNNNWNGINYPTVPSIAHKNYSDAFGRHDEERYTDYLNSVEKGTAEIKASQLFPYDIIKAYNAYDWGFKVTEEVNKTLESQWEALPKYLTDKKYLVMADTSGSMLCNNMLPISTSVGLAIKFAEENTGAFKGQYMTFSEHPTINRIKPNMTLHDKIEQVSNSDWGMNTNLEAAFELILNSAVRDKIPQEDMPEALLVISDMEIDCAISNRYSREGTDEALTFTEDMKDRFESAGYKMPIIIYWNVNARNNTFHATKNDNVRFVSGSSPAIFKDLCENMGSSPVDLMLNVLNSERYEVIK